jgi:hypothetical protein
MHRQYTNADLLPLQLGRHMPQHLVQGGLARCIRAKAIFVVTEQGRTAAVGGYEDDFLWWIGGRGVENGLRADDGPDCVGM